MCRQMHCRALVAILRATSPLVFVSSHCVSVIVDTNLLLTDKFRCCVSAPNIATELLAVLFSIREIPVSNFCPEVDQP
jgi:hypothetical protein